jgi:hypothetical protein
MCENEEDEEACVEYDAMQALLDAADFGAFAKQNKQKEGKTPLSISNTASELDTAIS